MLPKYSSYRRGTSAQSLALVTLLEPEIWSIENFAKIAYHWDQWKHLRASTKTRATESER